MYWHLGLEISTLSRGEGVAEINKGNWFTNVFGYHHRRLS